MTTLNSSSLTTLSFSHGQNLQRTNGSLLLHWHHSNPRNHDSLQIHSALRRPNKKKTTNPSSDRKVEMVIDLEDVANRASKAIKRFYTSSESKFSMFLSSGAETLRDLRTLIAIDSDRRIVISCRQSSLEFAASFLVWSFVVVFVGRVLVKLWLGFGLGLGFRPGFLIRRDRSLAGREVVVGRRFKEREVEKKNKKNFRVLVNPLSSGRGSETRISGGVSEKRVLKEEKLPIWWPDSITSPVLTVGKQEFQRDANRLIRAIMDYRMSGKDITEDDIVQLRRICRDSGVKVSIEPVNARDSFYRASVDFVLNTCSSTSGQSTLVQIDGEEVCQFVAGLADNIGLENIRAARIVCAAVAARTRSRFLQAWAFEIQGKRSEALEELSKICLIHRIFLPEKYSPEMEMVARGLEKHLKVEQREHLYNLFGEVCGPESRRVAAEALGLVSDEHAETISNSIHSTKGTAVTGWHSGSYN